MILKFISVKQVISKILSDLNIEEENIRISDMIDWCGEAIEKIGSVKQFNRVVSGIGSAEILALSNHQLQLPSDLYRLNSVAYSTNSTGPWFPMRLATSSFNSWSDASLSASSESEFIVSDEVILDLIQQLYRNLIENPIYAWFSKMDRATALEILNTDPNLRTLLTNMIKAAESDNSIYDSELTYSIKPGYINTNVKDGFIKLSYDALLKDSNGYPLIPDMISYIEAVYWYVTMKLKFPDYMAGRLNAEIYNSIRRSWNFYCKQAYGDSLMPNQDEMETIKGVWNKLIPEYNVSDSFYTNIGSTQYVKNFNL